MITVPKCQAYLYGERGEGVESPHGVRPRPTSLLLEECGHQCGEALRPLLTWHGDGQCRHAGTRTHLTQTHLLPSGRHGALQVGVRVVAGGGEGMQGHISGWVLRQAHSRVERLGMAWGRVSPGCRRGSRTGGGGADGCPSPLGRPLTAVTHDRHALLGRCSGHAMGNRLLLLLLLLRMQENIPLCLLLGDLTGQAQRRQHFLVQLVVW